MTVTSSEDQRGFVREGAARCSIAGIAGRWIEVEGCPGLKNRNLVRMRRLYLTFPTRRVSQNRSFGLISLVLALVYNLLEQEAAQEKDEDYRPNFQGRLGLWGGDVDWWFVGTGRLAGLSET